MKKVISFIMAATLTAGAFTACGDKDSSSSKSSSKDSYKQECAETMTKLFKAAYDGDADDMCDYLLPHKIAKLFKKWDASDRMYELFPMYIVDDIDDSDIDELEITVEDTEKADKDDIELLELTYSVYYNMFELLDDAGYDIDDMDNNLIDEDDIDMDKAAELSEALENGSIDEIDVSIKIEDAKYVTFTSDNEEIADELDGIGLLMYKVKGEDKWKLDMLASTPRVTEERSNKSKQATAEVTASTLYKTGSSAITDADVKGLDVSGFNVISSDKKKNVLASKDEDSLGGNLDTMKKYMKNYYDDIDNIDYFVIFEDVSCLYAAVDYDGFVGTYPADTVYTGNGNYDNLDTTDYDLDELYDLCMENIS